MNQKARLKRGDRIQVMRKRVSHLSAQKSQVSMDGTPCRMQNSHRHFRETVVPGSKVKQSTVFGMDGLKFGALHSLIRPLLYASLHGVMCYKTYSSSNPANTLDCC